MMSQKWDIILVGAGIGGLTAAAYLAKAGLRVLVLDRNPHPGGTAYAYHRKGFSFPMGPSWDLAIQSLSKRLSTIWR